MIYYSQSNTLSRIYLNSVDGIYIFFTKVILIIFTLIFLSNFLQVINQYSTEKENFLLARTMTAGVGKFIKSKVLLSNIILVLATQPFYWTMVILNDFHKSMEIRFIYFCSFTLLFTTLNLTIYSSYYILARSYYHNNYILGVKRLLKLTATTMTSLIFFAMTIVYPAIFIYEGSNYNKFYNYSNIIFISILSLHFIILVSSRYALNKASERIQNSET